MESKGHRWVSFPSKTYEKDGEKKYFSYIVFTKEKQKQLEDYVIPLLLEELE